MAAAMVDAGYADIAVSVTSSHYQSAERQFRYPIELNIQRKATSQYTVTGAGAMVVARGAGKVAVTEATIGRVLDLGIKDPNQMGPAMAPAAADTLFRHFADLGRTPEYYDLILTGDLGSVGSSILHELMRKRGVPLGDAHRDSGRGYSRASRCGVGQRCACAAVTLGGYVFKQMMATNSPELWWWPLARSCRP